MKNFGIIALLSYDLQKWFVSFSKEVSLTYLVIPWLQKFAWLSSFTLKSISYLVSGHAQCPVPSRSLSHCFVFSPFVEFPQRLRERVGVAKLSLFMGYPKTWELTLNLFRFVGNLVRFSASAVVPSFLHSIRKEVSLFPSQLWGKLPTGF